MDEDQSFEQLLKYPYEVLRAHVMLAGCEYHGLYQKNSYECNHCPDMESCIWVKQLPVKLSGNCSEQKQIMILEHALDSMTSYARLQHHDIPSCSCSNCQWICKALKTYNDLIFTQGGSVSVIKKSLQN